MGDGHAQYFWYKKYPIPFFEKSGLSNVVLFGSKISTPSSIAEMMANFECSNADSISSVHLNLDLGERSSLKGNMISVSLPYLDTWLTSPNQALASEMVVGR